jgi:hypothetical protein
VPTAPIITQKFSDFVKKFAIERGMPDMRLTFVPHPVAKKPAAVCRRYLLGKDPVTGIPVMDEIIAALTQPLHDGERRGGLGLDP